MLRRMFTRPWMMKRFLQDRQGAVAVLFGLTLVVLVGSSALAVDMGYLYWLKSRLQATADAAATAGASQLGVTEASVRAEALEDAGTNLPTGDHGTVLTEADVVLGHWHGTTREFIPIDGFGRTDVDACASYGLGGNDPGAVVLLLVDQNWNIQHRPTFNGTSNGTRIS